MASLSTQRASSSSSSTPQWRYDVFLSFYGKDTRNKFTDHLHAALIEKGILVFRDDEKLERGNYIPDELLKAIQESKYTIVVISENYAFSKWCLIELAQMVECMRDTGLTVLPIFYHVDPSHVGKQTESFAEAFASHEKDPKVDIGIMQKWRAALRIVGKISGWHVLHDTHESIVVKEISRRILSGLSRNLSNVSKDFVGIESRVKEMMTLLSKGLDDVRFLGICGMGGIGKTTLSKAIYDTISHQFEASSFITGIREGTRSNHGLVDLKKQLTFDILAERKINIWNDQRVSRVIETRLRNKKVLIVLDDVDRDDQLEALAGSHDWFGDGSRIIITSRDRHLMNRYVDDTYEVEVLKDAEALQLFSWKAFKKPHPEENYVELSKDVVSYAQGLPLALEVFGSYLYGRRIEFWISARNQLKEKPKAKILDKLQISFDGLEEDSQKQLFLDIACFFNESVYVDRDRIKHRLGSLGYNLDTDIDVLVDKSLLTISSSWGGILGMHDLLRKMGQQIVDCESAEEPGKRSRLGMHDLLRKMGQQIVDCESAEEPGKRSRLWRYEDILHVLKNNTGTDAVKGIVLKLYSQIQERLNIEAFSKMKKLKILEISFTGLEWHGDPSNFMLSNELCIINWCGYPLESLPTNFQPLNLIELIMPHSCMKQLWNGRKSLDKLKRIDLSFSGNLIKTPDLSGVQHLEELKLGYCTSLSKVHPSIGFLRQLKRLDLQGCKRLKRLPDLSGIPILEELELRNCTSLSEVHPSIGFLRQLKRLDLQGCKRLKRLPDLSGIPILEELELRNCTSLSEVHPSIGFLRQLKRLDLQGCKRLKRLPDLSGIPILEELELRNCTSLSEVHPSIGFLRQLKRLDLRDCKSLERLADEIISESLESLDLSGCSKLNKLPDITGNMTSLRSLHLNGTAIKELPLSFKSLSSLKYLDISNCSRLKKIPKNMISLLIPNSFSGLSSDGLIPSDHFSCLSSLLDLNLSRTKFTKIPDSAWQLSSLELLDLSYCNLLDGMIPNDLSCLSSLLFLKLNGNKFTRTPDSVAQLSRLRKLYLEDCSQLQLLPKLPLGLAGLFLRNCTSLKLFYNQMDIWTSNEKLLPFDCSDVTAYIDHDGKPFKSLHLLPPSPLWSDSDTDLCFYPRPLCGPALVESGIPEWFNDKSTNSKTRGKRMHTDEWKGYALFIVYQVHQHDEHESSNSRIFDGGNRNLPYFICQFQFNEVVVTKPLVLCAPGVPSVGASGFWVYIPYIWFFEKRMIIFDGKGNEMSNLEASITTGSLNVEVKEYAARVVRDDDDVSEFYSVVNSIFPRGLDLKLGWRSFLDFVGMNFLRVYDPFSIESFEKDNQRSKIRPIGNNFLTGIQRKIRTSWRHFTLRIGRKS